MTKTLVSYQLFSADKRSISFVNLFASLNVEKLKFTLRKLIQSDLTFF